MIPVKDDPSPENEVAVSCPVTVTPVFVDWSLSFPSYHQNYADAPSLLIIVLSAASVILTLSLLPIRREPVEFSI